jgi:HK97 family phage major capsid protein
MPMVGQCSVRIDIRELSDKATLDVLEQEELRRLDGAYDELDSEVKQEALRQKNQLREMELSRSQREPQRPMPLEEKPTEGFFKNRQERSNNNYQQAGGYAFNPDGHSLRDAFNRYIQFGASGISDTEYRALQADSDTAGGFLVAPVELAKDILAGLDNELQIRALARRFQIPTASSLGVPTLGHDFGDLTFTAELKPGSEDNQMDLQRRDLFPHPVARRIKVSNKLLRVSQMNPEAFVKERMIQVCGQVLENAYLNGSGQNQPLGIFVNSQHGISSSRDYICSTQTGVKADDLIRGLECSRLNIVIAKSWRGSDTVTSRRWSASSKQVKATTCGRLGLRRRAIRFWASRLCSQNTRRTPTRPGSTAPCSPILTTIGLQTPWTCKFSG